MDLLYAVSHNILSYLQDLRYIIAFDMLIVDITVTGFIAFKLLKYLIGFIWILVKITISMRSESLCCYTQPIINLYTEYVYIDSSTVLTSYWYLICTCLSGSNGAINRCITVRRKYNILTAEYNPHMRCRKY